MSQTRAAYSGGVQPFDFSRREPNPIPSPSQGLTETIDQHREPNLGQRDEELRRMVDSIPRHIVVLDACGNVIFANRQSFEYTGLTLNEVGAGDFREGVFKPEDVAGLMKIDHLLQEAAGSA